MSTTSLSFHPTACIVCSLQYLLCSCSRGKSELTPDDVKCVDSWSRGFISSWCEGTQANTLILLQWGVTWNQRLESVTGKKAWRSGRAGFSCCFLNQRSDTCTWMEVNVYSACMPATGSGWWARPMMHCVYTPLCIFIVFCPCLPPLTMVVLEVPGHQGGRLIIWILSVLF